MSVEAIITIALAIIAILVSLFTKALREAFITSWERAVSFFREHSKNIFFRTILLLVINISGLLLLYWFKIILSFEILLSFIVVCIILGFGTYVVYLPIKSELLSLKSHIKTVETELNVLSSAKKLELQNIQSRWPEFVKLLSDKPGFQTVSAFLQSSEPVFIENDVLLIGVPEAIHEVIDAINFEKITPQYQIFFGRAYKTKLIVVKQQGP